MHIYIAFGAKCTLAPPTKISAHHSSHPWASSQKKNNVTYISTDKADAHCCSHHKTQYRLSFLSKFLHPIL